MIPALIGQFDDGELYYAFKKFDLDNSGEISVDELKLILSKIGQHYSRSTIASMIMTVDANKDGKLSFQGLFGCFILTYNIRLAIQYSLH